MQFMVITLSIVGFDSLINICTLT